MTRKLQQGFTFIELLIVVAIIGLLAAIILIGLQGTRPKARDSIRISTFRSFHDALELYYSDHGYYPAACGEGYYGFSYTKKNSDGTCVGAINLRFDNSTSVGFMADLFPDYLGISDWNDPTGPTDHGDRNNCRYVIPRSEGDCNGNNSHCALNCKPQRYFLHCAMEETLSDAAENDGGTNDNAFEVSEPDKWICLTGMPS